MRYKIFYGENENDYIVGELEKEDIIYDYLSEAKAFELFYSDMIMCNNYFKDDDCSNIDILINTYIEEEDYYLDEYQYFIVDSDFNEETLIKATEKMYNTLYYDNAKELYIVGVTDYGSSRTIVGTNLRVEEMK